MRNKTLFTIAVLIAAVLIIALAINQATSQRIEATTPPPPIQEEAAVERAIAIAQSRGLQEDDPTRLAAKLMTLREYHALTDSGSEPGAAKFGLDPDQQVWVVTIRGPVDWSGPGRTRDEQDKFDNITIVISAQTGKHIGTAASRVGRLPVDVP
jgi:hypothetical protein